MNWDTVKVVLVILAVLLVIRFAKTVWMILQSYHLWGVPTCSHSASLEIAEEHKRLRITNICNAIADLIADRHPVWLAELSIIGLAVVAYAPSFEVVG